MFIVSSINGYYLYSSDKGQLQTSRSYPSMSGLFEFEDVSPRYKDNDMKVLYAPYVARYPTLHYWTIDVMFEETYCVFVVTHSQHPFQNQYIDKYVDVDDNGNIILVDEPNFLKCKRIDN